jgi:hypothetical protein
MAKNPGSSAYGILIPHVKTTPWVEGADAHPIHPYHEVLREGGYHPHQSVQGAAYRSNVYKHQEVGKPNVTLVHTGRRAGRGQISSFVGHPLTGRSELVRSPRELRRRIL